MDVLLELSVSADLCNGDWSEHEVDDRIKIVTVGGEGACGIQVALGGVVLRRGDVGDSGVAVIVLHTRDRGVWTVVIRDLASTGA